MAQKNDEIAPLTITKNLEKLKIRGARDEKGNVIRSFTVRETNGNDETLATQSASQKKESLITPTEEIVKLALVEVNGKPVRQPYDEYDRWNSKARTLVLAAYRQCNGISEQEMHDFLAADATEEYHEPSQPEEIIETT